MIPGSSFVDKVMDLLVDMICVVDVEGRYIFVSAGCENVLGYKPKELIGRHMIEFVHPDDRAETLAAAGKVMSGEPHLNFENRYLHKNGHVVDIMWSARWSEQDRVRLAVARDVTAVRRAARLQSALFRVSEAANTAEGLPELYRDVHRIVGTLLPAANFCVVLYDAPSQTLSFPYCVDERHPQRTSQRLPVGTPITRVIESGEALLAASGETGGNDWLGAPLITQQGIMGAVVVHTYSPRVRFTEQDKELLQFVSTQVAAAIERKRNEAQLRRMALYDPLTELPNRGLFRDRLDTALKRAHRDAEQLALLYIDLNGFKEINDTLGHDAGDRLLRGLAERLIGRVRESDTVARIGGDEFIVLLTNIGAPARLDRIIDDIRQAIAAPLAVDGRSIAVTASIGIAVYPHDGTEPETLLRHADAGMYVEKRRLTGAGV